MDADISSVGFDQRLQGCCIATWRGRVRGISCDAGKEPRLNDTIHQIFQDEDAYKVRITRLGEFMHEAEGLSSYADAASWIAQAQRLGSVRAEQQKPISSPHMRMV
jgi:hypothetical protein